MAVELPPPYQELAKELQALPAGATFEDAKPIFEKLESLPQPTLFSAEELDNFTNLPESSEVEKARLEKELAQFMSTKVGLVVIQGAARNAGTQVKKINVMLDELYGKLEVVDSKYQSNFSKPFLDFIAVSYTYPRDPLLNALDASTSDSFYSLLYRCVRVEL